MAGRKTVRLRSIRTGVVVETSEENAARLVGEFEPVKKATTPKKSSASDKSK